MIPASISLDPYVKPRRNAPPRPGNTGEIAGKEILLHSSEHPKLDYTAREEEEGGSNTLLKHYIGVYDPETGKMEVLEARKVVVRGVVRAHQATAADDTAVVSTNANASRVLLLTFCRSIETAETISDRHSVRRRQRRPLRPSQRTLSTQASSSETHPRPPNQRSSPQQILLCSLVLRGAQETRQQRRNRQK